MRFAFRALLVAAPLALAAASSPASASEHRTRAECERLPGSATEGDRAACLHCIARPSKHHFDEERPGGKRCREEGEKDPAPRPAPKAKAPAPKPGTTAGAGATGTGPAASPRPGGPTTTPPPPPPQPFSR